MVKQKAPVASNEKDINTKTNKTWKEKLALLEAKRSNLEKKEEEIKRCIDNTPAKRDVRICFDRIKRVLIGIASSKDFKTLENFFGDGFVLKLESGDGILSSHDAGGDYINPDFYDALEFEENKSQ